MPHKTAQLKTKTIAKEGWRMIVLGKFGVGHLVDVSSSWLDPRHSQNDLPRQIVYIEH